MKEIILKELESKLVYVETQCRVNPNRMNLAYIVDIENSINLIKSGRIQIN